MDTRQKMSEESENLRYETEMAINTIEGLNGMLKKVVDVTKKYRSIVDLDILPEEQIKIGLQNIKELLKSLQDVIKITPFIAPCTKMFEMIDRTLDDNLKSAKTYIKR